MEDRPSRTAPRRTTASARKAAAAAEAAIEAINRDVAPAAPADRPAGRRSAEPEARQAAAAAAPPTAKAAAPVLDRPAPIDEILAVTVPTTPVAPDASLGEQRAWAELRRLQLDTERAVVELEAMRRREREAAADAGRAHVYTFYAGVDADSVRECMAELAMWSRRDPGCPITIIFNSPGGSVHDGLALFDHLRLLRGLGHHVTTIALGRAASMGAVLLQAGDRRLVGANAFVLVHEVSHSTGGKVSEMADGVEFTRRLQARLLDILAERSTLGPRDIQRRWARKEWWLSADEAVSLGFADEVL